LIFKILLTITPLILFVLLTNYDVSAQENTDENESSESAIVEWIKRTSAGSDIRNYDLKQIQLVINEIQLSFNTNLILIDFTLENNGNETIRLSGGEILDLRTFDPKKYEAEAKRRAPDFNYGYEYLIPEIVQSQFANVDFAEKCQRLNLNVNPDDSANSVICFNPSYDSPLNLSGNLEYYLVLSNRPANSCPFCKPILLNDKITSGIPQWIKNNAAWWSKNQIEDSDFILGLEFLIKQEIITVSSTDESKQSEDIPEWVKNTAGWWSEGFISDDDFIQSIQWLINNGFIRI